VATPLSNLPAHATSLIGREEAVQTVSALVHDPEAGLITLTGTGGSGKTRLALAVANQALTFERFSDGVWIASLAPAHDPLLVPGLVATSLGIPEQAGRSMRDTLRDELRSRSLLLVLDNCEHIVQAVAELAEELLGTCPRICILATSREPIRIRGERVWQVAPLPVAESVQLFVERARAVQSTFTIDEQSTRTIACICATLAGLPLAIELAAARAHVLTPDQILSRLDHAFSLLVSGSRTSPPRQQTLRATLDWSYDLLDPGEQELFEQLSVFAGGFDLDDAAAIWGPTSRDILEALTVLVDKCLVITRSQPRGMRYGLLEPVRQYALDRLQQRGEWEATRRRHAAHFLHFAERAEDGLKGPETMDWQARMGLEHDNIRAVLRRCIDANEPETALRIGSALRNYWMQFGFRGEAGRWLSEALELPGEVPAAVRAGAIQTAAVIATGVSDYRTARLRLEQAVELWRKLGDVVGLSSTLVYLGRTVTVMAEKDDEYERGKMLLREGIKLNRDLGDIWWVAQALAFLGIAAWEHAELDLARASLQEADEVFTQLSDGHARSHLRSKLGGVLLDQGEVERAAEWIERSLSEARAINCVGGSAEALYFLARVERLRGDRVLATEHALEAAVFEYKMGDAAFVLNSLELLGGILGDAGKAELAIRLLSASSTLRQTAGVPMPPITRAAFERDVAVARGAIGDSRFGIAWADGSAMSIDEAVAFARSSDHPSLPRTDPLSERERQVVVLVARGYTNRQIAEELVISERTVHGHVNHILTKLGLSSRAQAAVWAVEHQLATTRT
jgi:non-specific serine/threonine protein kinase